MGRLFVIIGGFLVLVLCAALVVPPFIDWTGYRAQFEREASRILGHPVRVNGAVSARLLPFPSVTFSDIRVENADQQVMLTMENFSMDAELMPYLRGQVLIFDMRMERPSLYAQINSEGQFDWILTPDQNFNPQQIKLENLKITDGRIVLRDDANRTTYQAEQLNAQLSANTLAGPWRVNGHMRFNGQPTGIEINSGEKKADAGLRLRARFTPDELPVSFETDGELTLNDARPVYSGQFSFLTLSEAEISAKAANADLMPAKATQNLAQNPAPKQDQKPKRPQDQLMLDKLRLTGQFHVETTTLGVPEFRMEQGQADAPYVINGNAQFDFGDNPHFTVSADGQQVFLDAPREDSRTDNNANPVEQTPISGTAAGTTGTEAAVSVPLRERLESLQRMVERIPVPDIPGSVDLRLPAIIANGTIIRAVTIRAEPDEGAWNIRQLQADLPGRTQIEAQGRLQLGDQFGFNGNFLIASRQPSGLIGWLTGEASAALRALPAAGFSGKVRLGRAQQKVDDLEIVLGDAKLTGQFIRNSADAENASAVLDVKGQALDAASLQLFSGLLLNEDGLSALAGESLRVALKAGPVSFADIKADGLDTIFRIGGGKLDFDRLLISGMEGATVSATGSLRPFDMVMNASLDATLIGDDLAPLIRSLSSSFPQHGLLRYLAERSQIFPDIFANSKLDLIASAVNLFAQQQPEGQIQNPGKPEEPAKPVVRSGRLKTDKSNKNTGENGTTGSELSFSLNGQTGQMIVAVAGTSQGQLQGAEPMQLSLTANAKAASGETLMALLGLPALPLGLMGEAEANLQAQGAPSVGMKTELEISGDDGKARLDGVITLVSDDLTASGKATLTSTDLEPFLATIGASLPLNAGFGEGLPVNIISDFQFGKNVVRLPDLRGQLNGETVTARIDGSWSGSGADGNAGPLLPQLRGEITLESLDLQAIAAMMAGLSADELTATGPSWSKIRFGKTPSLALASDLKINAGQARLGLNDPVEEFSMRLVKSDGQLDLSELSGSWHSGRLSGKLGLNNSQGTVLINGDLRLSGADLSELYQPQMAVTPLSGISDLKLSFNGSGKSVAETVGSLVGEGSYSVEHLKIAELNSAAFREILRQSDMLNYQSEQKKTENARNQLIAGLEQGGQFMSGQMQGPLTLAGGVLRLSGFQTNNDQARLHGDIQLDLSRSALSGSAVLDLIVPASEQVADQSADDGQLPLPAQLPIAISGTYDQPKIKFDRQPMQQFLLRRALLREQQRAEAVQALVLEKQRLKREAAYYIALENERLRVKLQAEEQARIKAEADAAAAAAQAEAEAKAKAQHAARQKAEEAAKHQAEEQRRLQLEQQQSPVETIPQTEPQLENQPEKKQTIPDINPSIEEFLQNLPND